jgi:hypothetical protein
MAGVVVKFDEAELDGGGGIHLISSSFADEVFGKALFRIGASGFLKQNRAQEF